MPSDAAVQAATLVPTDAEKAAVDAARAYAHAVRRGYRSRVLTVLQDHGHDDAAELVRGMSLDDQW